MATVQCAIAADVSDNAAAIRHWMREAAHAGAKLIHFPEAALSGYVKRQITNWLEVDWLLLHEELETIQQLAATLELCTVIGCNHRFSASERPYNSLYIISAQGELTHRYDKQYLSHTELRDWYTPAQGLTVFELEGWRFGCALCIEVHFPELFLAYGAQDVDCMLVSTYSNDLIFAVEARAHAAINNYWLSMAVPVQAEQRLHSQVIAPNGVVQSIQSSAGMLLTTLDTTDARWDIALNYAKPWRKEARARIARVDKTRT